MNNIWIGWELQMFLMKTIKIISTCSVIEVGDFISLQKIVC